MKITSIVSAALVLFCASTAFAQTALTSYRVPDNAMQCYAACSGPTANPNPSVHPECDAKKNPALTPDVMSIINSHTRQLNVLRGRLDVLEGRMDVVEKVADRAEQKADAAIKAVIEVDQKVDRQGGRIHALEGRVATLGKDQGALTQRMDAVSINDQKQDREIAELQKDMKETKTDVKQNKQDVQDLKKSANKLTARAAWLVLDGLGGDKYSAPAVFGSLGIGLGPKSCLNFEGGLTANRSNGKSSMGGSFKIAPAYDFGAVVVSAGWVTYALGLDKTTDATVVMSGAEIGLSIPVGPVQLDLNVIPGGFNYATMHDPRYLVGGNAGVSYTF